MKKMIFAALFGVAFLATSCDKEGGKCVCNYSVAGTEVKKQDIDLEGSNMTCAEYEESMKAVFDEIKCRAK